MRGPAVRYRFNGFELDSERVQVFRNGTPLALRPKCYDLLLYLLQRPGILATKDELLTEVWPEVTVQESSLTQCVAQLRDALSPEGGAMIRTVARRGYILEADVNRTGAGAGEQLGFRRAPLLVPGLAVLAVGLVLGYGASAVTSPSAQAGPGFWPGPVLETRETILGQPLPEFSGPIVLRADVKFVPPGQTSPLHSHDDLVFAFVLRGEGVIDYEGTSRTLRRGDAVVEAVGAFHQARNVSDELFEVLVVTIGEAGVPAAGTSGAGSRD